MDREGIIRHRAKRLLKEVGGSGPIVAVTDACHSFLSMDAVWWLTGFKATGDSIAGIDADGTVELRVSNLADAKRAERTAVADRIELKAKTFAGLGRWASGDGCVETVGAARLNRERRAQFENEFRDLGPVLLRASRSADKLELSLFQAASLIAEECYDRLLEELRPGVAEYEVVGRFSADLRAAGSDDNFLFMSASGHNRAVHRPTDRILEEGDIVLAEISPSIDGVYTQICRTISIGEPRSLLKTKHSLLCDAFRAGLAACRPGLSLGDVTVALNNVLIDAGYGEYCRPPHMRVRGHGLGLRSTLPGDLTVDSEVLIEEGDLFVLHPNQYLPDIGYLMCGEPVAVNFEGARTVSAACAGLGVAG